MNSENIIELMPLYLNGRLTADKSYQVEKAIEVNDDLKHELDFLKMLERRIKSEHVISPGEMGWARLKRDIAVANNSSKPQATTPVKHSSYAWWKAAAVAASITLVIQSGFMVQQFATQPEGYQLLSSEELKNTLKVKFVAGISESEVRTLLLNLQGNIVKGPSAVGIYHIHFEDRTMALTRLSASEVVEYAKAAQE